MLPFIYVCRDLGIPVLVMNPNVESNHFTGDMLDHATFVWDKYVKNSGFT